MKNFTYYNLAGLIDINSLDFKYFLVSKVSYKIRPIYYKNDMQYKRFVSSF